MGFPPEGRLADARQQSIESEAEAESCMLLRRELERCEVHASALQQQNKTLRDRYHEREVHWETTVAQWTSSVGSSEFRANEQLASMQEHTANYSTTTPSVKPGGKVPLNSGAPKLVLTKAVPPPSLLPSSQSLIP